MASVHAGRPLLDDFESSDVDFPVKNAAFVSLRALEDGEDEFDDVLELSPRRGFWKRFLMSVRRRRNGTDSEPEGTLRLPVEETKGTQWGKWRWKRLGIKAALGLFAFAIFFFGIVHLINVFSSMVNLLRDDSDPFPPSWAPLPQFRPGHELDITDLTRDVTPIHCHSHNDYWRRIPLYDALRWGCTGVEADVWLFDDELFVGHKTNALTRDRTFRSMYVDPLVRILDSQNTINEIATSSDAAKYGVYEVDPTQTLVLLVDFKNSGHDTYPVVAQQLAPFREKGYLTYFDGESTIPGPITVVATGNAPFDLITANSSYRDVFFDAPLDRLYEEPLDYDSPPTLELQKQKPGAAALPSRRNSGQGTVGTDDDSIFDLTNSYYASVDFKKAVGWAWWGRLSDHQMKLIRGQIQGAKKRGLKSRYWGAPKWPVGLRNHVWEVLVREGVDYLNGDDLRAMTRLDWSKKKHWGLLG